MTDGHDLIARLRALAPEKRELALRAAGEAHVKAVDSRWPIWTHAGQLPPHDDWDVWVMMAGRGFGKTRAGAEWVAERARETPDARIALVAATPAEARRVMIEGRGGLFAAARDGEERSGMRWEPGLGRLTFASGAEAFTFSGADGESLRGPEHHFAWCDELAKWKKAQTAWDNLLLGLRAGARPQVLVTTTPRSVPVLRALLAMENVLRTGGASRDNPHLPESSLRMVERLHGGTRFGRQELEGELIEDVEGALWPRDLIEASRTGTVTSDCPLVRVVIGVDPPATAAGDACGIVACGLGADPSTGSGRGIAYVLGDHSVSGLSPEQWARKVAGAAEKWRADRVVAEGNQGGEMVETVLRGAGLRLPVKRVHARIGKVARAEPIAAFFESSEAKFAGRFPALEDELAGLVVGGFYRGPGRSPDRADACIWALTELLLGAPPRGEPRVRGF
ncbi:MAG TPA: terminase family protein [Allosphingosinicella sp.]|nr:terminase family protein [Allosphingosinicella sp.]